MPTTLRAGTPGGIQFNDNTVQTTASIFKLIDTYTYSDTGAAALNLPTIFNSGYSSYIIEIPSLIPLTDNVQHEVRLQIYRNGSISSGNYYSIGNIRYGGNSAPFGSGGGVLPGDPIDSGGSFATHMILHKAFGQNTSTGVQFRGRIFVSGITFANTVGLLRPSFKWDLLSGSTTLSTGSPIWTSGMGWWTGNNTSPNFEAYTTYVNGFSLSMTPGDIRYTIKIYGY